MTVQNKKIPLDYVLRLLSCYEHWTVGMMHHIITDTAQNGSSDGSHASGSHNDYGTGFFLSHLANVFPGTGEFSADGVLDLNNIDFEKTLFKLRLQIQLLGTIIEGVAM